MCGIAGFIASNAPDSFPYNGKLYWALRSLFVDVTSRGVDAGGYAGITAKKGSLVYAKAPGAAFNLPKLEEDMMRCKAFIVHARLATHGDAKDNVNNHPFISKDGSLALIHNGVITNYSAHAAHTISACDSESILRRIEGEFSAKDAPVSLSTAIKAGIAPLRGAMACAMLNVDEPDTLYLFRSAGNSASPLCTVRVNKDLVLFASTWDMLWKAVTLAKISTGQNKIIKEDDNKIITVKIGDRTRRMDIPAQTYRSWGENWEDYEEGYYRNHDEGATSGYNYPSNYGETYALRRTGYSPQHVAKEPEYQEYYLGEGTYLPTRCIADSEGKYMLFIKDTIVKEGVNHAS